MFEAKVILLERSITELVIKLDTFMCMEETPEDDSIDTRATEEVTETEETSSEQVEVKFPCHLCDFESSRSNGLVIHIGRKHKRSKDISSPIGQFDGNTTNQEILDTDDLLYERTENYWKRGWLGTVYQNYLDALKIIDESSMNEVEKKTEN